MDDKQIKGIANSRAYGTLKPYRFALVLLAIALYIFAVVLESIYPLAVMGLVLLISYAYIRTKETKIQRNIIQNKESQVIKDEDIRGLVGDEIAKTLKYRILWLGSSLLCLIPLAPTMIDIDMSLWIRLTLAIVGIMCSAGFILWNRKQIKIQKEKYNV